MFRLLSILAPLLLLAPVLTARADYLVTDVDDVTRKVAGLRIEAGDRLICVLPDGKEEALPLADVVEVSFATTSLPPVAAPLALTLTTGDYYVGAVAAVATDGFTFTTEDFGGITAPLTQVRRLERFRPSADPQPAHKLENDHLALSNGDHDDGTVLKVGPEGVTIRSVLYGKEKTYALKDLDALELMELEAAPAEPSTLLVTVRGLSGSRATGKATALKDQKLAFTSLFGVEATLNVSTLNALYVRNGRCVFLSDLPFESLVEKWDLPTSPGMEKLDADTRRAKTLQRDRTSDVSHPTPLRLRKTVYRKGLAPYGMTCEVTFALNGEFREFRSIVGIDDRSIDIAKARFVVTADGKELFRREWMTLADEPIPLRLDVKGVKLLTLSVDGREPFPYTSTPVHGCGTWADWAGARVIK